MHDKARGGLIALKIMLVLALALPTSAFATIAEFDEDWIASSTNPGKQDVYEVVWRESWGNSPLAQFEVKVPAPEPLEPAIVGGFYYLNRPFSAPATITPDMWADCYNSPISDKETWRLAVDLPGEFGSPGPLFDASWLAPVVPDRPYEGPYSIFMQMIAKDTTQTARGAVTVGLDMTPPAKVTGLTATPGAGNPPVNGWLTQSRVHLKWDDIVYDRLSGTGYFELFIDGKPYLTSVPNSKVSRKVYDLKEHYPGYGFAINTKREMVIEDLPAGEHALQVRAVDRATNAGPLSDPVNIKVDPDLPQILVSTPEFDGGRLGAKPLFKAGVTDMAGVASVEFSVDGTPVGTDNVTPYEMAADLSALSDGSSHTVRVTAVDMAGRTNFAEKTFVIDKNPSVIRLSPSAGQTVSPLVPLKVAYAGIDDVTSVEFRVDGALVASEVPAADMRREGEVSVLHRASAGPHTLTVTVTNDVGGVATVNGAFTVDPAMLPYLPDYGATQPSNGPTPVWYDTEYPAFSAISDDSVENPTEVLYVVDRTPNATIDPLDPNAYYASFRTEAGTTYFNGVIDQNGVYLSNPVALDGALQLPGVARPTEGVWYTHAAVRNAAGQSGSTVSTVYGIDLTPPSQVTGVAAYANATSPAPVSGWLQQTRAVIKWNGSERDALSGTAAYNVYLDGERIGDEGETIAFQPGRATMSLTLEDLKPGAHTVTITAVDRAGNEGPASAPIDVNIFSAPTVTISNPSTAGLTLPTPSALRATVRDAAGIANVEFVVDGVVARTFAPTASDPTLLVCGADVPLSGGPHTLLVRATSVSGPVSTVSRSFIVDTTLPPEVDPNPGGGGSGGGPTVTPAFTWFRTPFPTFSALPSDVPTDTTELLYLVNRTSVTPIDPTMPNLYDAFFDATGTTYFSGVIDQMGVYLSNPGAYDGAIQMPGRTSSPIEGVWYIHAMARNALGDGSPLTHVAYGVDLTRPAVVTGVQVYANSLSVTPITGQALTQNRAVIRWSGVERDSLSGTRNFVVYVDGVALGSDGSIGFQAGRSVMSLTVEDLGPGRHTVQVAAVDRALNEGPKSTPVTFYVDSDTPAVSITSPSSTGMRVGSSYTVKAVATDGAGITSIEFKVDGVVMGTMSPPSPATRFDASRKLDLSSFGSGTHTLTVTTRDVAGRTSATSRGFVLDKTAPTISSVTGAPSPFFPRKRDGYKDDFKVKFRSSEAGTMKLTVRNSSGNVVRTVTKSVAAGSNSITWNGKYASGSVKSGKFTYRLTMTDAAGNARSTSARKVSVKFYELVKTGSGSIKVIER